MRLCLLAVFGMLALATAAPAATGDPQKRLTIRGRFDLVLLGRGRADVALFMLSPKPFTAQFERSLAQTISSRLRP